MALHQDLPIYRTGTQLLSLAVRAQEQMPRGVKRSLGEKISQHCIDMLNEMAMANATKRGERMRHVEQLLAHQRTLTVLLRVSHDNRYVATKIWSDAVLLLDSIGKQGGGWLKSAANGAPAA